MNETEKVREQTEEIRRRLSESGACRMGEERPWASLLPREIRDGSIDPSLRLA
jgi:hypothetical protein